MGHKVPCKSGMLICHLVTSRAFIFLQREAVLSPCNVANAHLTAFIMCLCLLVTSRPMKFGMCPLVLQKLVLSVPFFHRWQGSWGADPRVLLKRGHKANASPGRQPEAPGRSWGFGHQQHPKPENRDSQHMQNQHRGSFPEEWRTPLQRPKFFRVRQRSGEGVVWRNGCPKGCFWRVRFFSAPLRFVLKNT